LPASRTAGILAQPLRLAQSQSPALPSRHEFPKSLQRSYKFAFERHLVDKCLSHFAMLLNSPFHREERNPATWDEYLARGQFPIDTDLYTDEEGKFIIDKIYKYEGIIEALPDIAVKTGVQNRVLDVSENLDSVITFRHCLKS
jgi:hypothetical protein